MLKWLIDNPLLLVTSCIVLGELLGSIEIKRIKLGSSATLFVGLIMSYLLTTYIGAEIKINKILFLLSLIGFIGSVGLIASKNIKEVLKNYGVKFLALALIITTTGALSTYLFTNLFYNLKTSVIGTYVGALTSSPGLATALEIGKTMLVDQSANVGLGYSIAYVPGVLVVIVFAQIMGKNKEYNLGKEVDTRKGEETNFQLVSFMIVLLFGIIIGLIKININNTSFSLGMTGGVLISALLFGSLKKIGKLSFEFNTKQIGVIRDISLNMFLAIVGLNYGYQAVSAIYQSGVQLLGIGLLTGSLSIAMGYFVGKHVLKIESVYLVGGICGGMTSTPGLAAAIDSFASEDVVTGYGATYPFALIFMILYTNLLFMGS